MLSEKPYEVPPYLLGKCEDQPPVPSAVVGADHPVAMESARQATQQNLILPVFVGDPDAIRAIARSMDWDISGFRIVAAAGDDKAPAAAVALARGHEVAALMKGQVHTDALMGAVVNRETGLRTDRRLSHIFHMTVPGRERVLMITEGAVNVSPHTEAKIHITRNAAELAHALGKC